MASIVANLPPPTLLIHGAKTLFGSPRTVAFSPVRGTRNCRVISKAAGESSESSTSLGIVESVQDYWDNSEDRYALVGLGFAAIAAFWASTSLVSAVDKLPIIPGVLELIGILFSSWFTYRYLLFKPDREELFQIIGDSVSEILG